MRRVFCIALIALTALPGAAAAQGPLDDFRKNGSINPCRYSDKQLRDGLNGLPPDVQQYAPGLADQLSAGREGCGGSSPGSSGDTRSLQSITGPAAPGGGGSTGAGARRAQIPAPPAPDAGERLRLANVTSPAVDTPGSEAPAWLTVALILAALLAGTFALLRLRGLSPERITKPLRASFADAGGRASDSLAEAWESLRLGR